MELGKLIAVQCGRYSWTSAWMDHKERREMERRLNDPAVNGTTVLATNALELGVDIEGLDVCFMDQIPPRRADMLQRIGRVGRRQDRLRAFLAPYYWRAEERRSPNSSRA